MAYLIKDGITDKFYQYECMNISQVKNTINEITKTKSTTSDWKDLCYGLKNDKAGAYGCSANMDYTFFDDKGKEQDCSVWIGYDHNIRIYFVWIEL